MIYVEILSLFFFFTYFSLTNTNYAANFKVEYDSFSSTLKVSMDQ